MTETRQIRLGRLFERRKILGFVDEPMLSVFREHGVVLKDDMVNHNQTAEDRSIYQLVEPGWLAVNRMKAWQGSLGVSAHRGIMSGHYICFAPRHSEHDRYLHYLLRSPRMTAHFAAISRGVRPGQIEIDNDQLAATPLDLPSTDEQRRIADFLDDRVARIDQIITARRTQMDHVDDALDAEWNSLGARLVEHGPVIPLRRVLASIVDGPFGSSLTSSHYTDEGTRVIRLGNIGKAAFRDGDAAFISDQYAAELRSHSVSPGDLLMAGLGDERWPLGRCAVAPEDLGPAIVKADCYRIRLDARVRHDFAAAYISSPRSRAAILLLSRGSTRARLNTDLARGVELPLVGLEMQREYLRALGEARSSSGQASRLLEGVVHRFAEYKQSLITAAVTGEIDVTTACSGIPG